MTAEPPALRASDAERERTVLALRDAAAEGRLTLEELAGRLDRALTATTRGELEPLTGDLPAAPPAEAAAGRAPARWRGTRWIVGIMGGGDRTGRWRIAPRCTVINAEGLSMSKPSRDPRSRGCRQGGCGGQVRRPRTRRRGCL